ncbi:prepilin-type N-terminal cleavage/methylation domain-containing protein [Litoribacillus peritrichatus]|uniref:Prepilin-type N-terminal cleavage/methylation domain-containing protein n=1 Tax=Litoribacillus peritrichatus TaxID=718191 RepID=A0ABP7NDB2_9GAMM
MIMQRKDQGFTLIEILVAMVIASILMLAVIRLFTRVGETYELNADALKVMETARTAMNFIKEDLTQAGYLGCVMTDITDIKSTVKENEDLRDVRTEPHITGGAENFVTAVYGSEGGSNPDSLSLFYQEDLDIRVLDFQGGSEIATAGVIVEAMNVYDSAGNSVISVGDWLTISDCAKGHAFILTANPTKQAITSGSRYYGFTADDEIAILLHDTTAFSGYSNSQTTFTNFGFDPAGGAGMVNRFHHITYVVADSEIDGGATKSLFRLENGDAVSKSNEVVRFVQDFQLEFGEDTNFDGVVDNFVDATSDMGNDIVAVKVALEISSGTQTEKIENIFKVRNRGM